MVGPHFYLIQAIHIKKTPSEEGVAKISLELNWWCPRLDLCKCIKTAFNLIFNIYIYIDNQ